MAKMASQLSVSLLLFALFGSAVGAGDDFHVTVSMPLSHPTEPETYLCAPKKLDLDLTDNNDRNGSSSVYVTGFETLADEMVAHHVILFGCRHPGKTSPIFNCGEMESGKKSATASYRPCGRGGATTILYAWTARATPLTLPADVAFRVGGDSGVDWLVLQVHYASVSYVPERGDDTAVVVAMSRAPRPKRAGVLLMATGGYIPPKETIAMEVACQLDEDGVEMHPLAFRVHTHLLGTDVRGWKVLGGGKEWRSIGRAHPQLPQIFNMIDQEGQDDIILRSGDTIATRCTMSNFRSKGVSVGPAADDEMCNFYLMYWVSGDRLPRRQVCWSAGPPFYSFEGGRRGGFGAGLDNVPSTGEEEEEEEKY